MYRYTEFKLILDFVDAESKELIWRGGATSVVDAAGATGMQLSEAVNKILEKFPPPSIPSLEIR